MKNLPVILSVLALALAGYSVYSVSNRNVQPKQSGVVPDKASSPASSSSFRIAYFDLDSLAAHYNYYKDAERDAKEKENAVNAELNALQNKYQKRVAEWQKKGNAITQAESQQMQQEYAEMQQSFQSRKETLQEGLAKNNGMVMTDIKKRIETFLTDYNKNKNYSFIFAYDPTSPMYYRDSAYNITSDVIDGLNAAYKKKN
ncbi:MAG: OmpH family outer membrane protein [Bacteroidetes bacterium]|nr:OmpH family outer membrane protein [Bacteroidota bacterium]